jgi:acetylornithine deacetylase/succinyl-diaminopimelate desuccinylase-like protein
MAAVHGCFWSLLFAGWALGLGAAHSVYADNGAESTLREVREYRLQQRERIFAQLFQFLEIPNVASDSVNIRKNAEHLVSMLDARGVETRLLETEGAPPVVFGHLRVAGARRTVVFYAHYDGQPADAAGWQSEPWRPLLRDGALFAGAQVLPRELLHGEVDPEWRIYARSASDDKSPIVALLTALDAVRAAGREPSVNLKFFFEGEEEAGSPHLDSLLREHAALLQADVWLFCDGPIHQSGRPQVVFGVRGVVGLEMTFYGPTRSLHSGHYGNWAPNPIAILTECLAGMRTADGRVLVAAFYDDVRAISEAEREALAAVPAVEERLRAELSLAATEADGARLMDRLMLPAMNLRGIEAGRVGNEAKNAIPTEARASIDFRLVPEQQPERVRQVVEAHLREHGYRIVYERPDAAARRRHPRTLLLEWGSGYPALRTPMDRPVSRAVVECIEAALGDVVRIPTLGGSLPLHLFHRNLRAPVIVVPMVNHDNNQHAADENLRIQNLWDGIDMYAMLMARLGEVW